MSSDLDTANNTTTLFIVLFVLAFVLFSAAAACVFFMYRRERKGDPVFVSLSEPMKPSTEMGNITTISATSVSTESSKV